MTSPIRKLLVSTTLLLASTIACAAGTVGTTFPAGFPAIEDTSLGKAVIGFGAAGAVNRTPVIFLHGTNDTPFATACNPYGRIHVLAQFLANNGYSTSELWGLGYQGDQCDLAGDQTLRSRIAHTNAANVPDLRRFVRAVLAFTGAKQGLVDTRANFAAILLSFATALLKDSSLSSGICGKNVSIADVARP
jgi:hypothetical protein